VACSAGSTRKSFGALVACLFFICGPSFVEATDDWPDASYIEIESGIPVIQDVAVDKFDRPGSWRASISPDEGVLRSRIFEPESGRVAFGVRVAFTKRGPNPIFVSPVKPIFVSGIVKSVSVQILGRSFDHALTLVLSDFNGTIHELYVGRLDHAGWKTLSVSLSPPSADGKRGIIQRDAHCTRPSGISILGFRIDCDPLEAYGTFYTYFADLRAFAESDGGSSPPQPSAPQPSAPQPSAPQPSAPASDSSDSPEPPDTEKRGNAPPGGAAALPDPFLDAEKPEISPAPISLKPTTPDRPSAAETDGADENKLESTLRAIRDALAAAKEYPAAARRRNLEGTLVVSLDVAGDGSLSEVRIVSSSGSEILDEAGIDLVKGVFPVANGTGKTLTVTERIAYRLND
jgi:TonB family protein